MWRGNEKMAYKTVVQRTKEQKLYTTAEIATVLQNYNGYVLKHNEGQCRAVRIRTRRMDILLMALIQSLYENSGIISQSKKAVSIFR
jgi:hypothetical protein